MLKAGSVEAATEGRDLVWRVRESGGTLAGLAAAVLLQATDDFHEDVCDGCEGQDIVEVAK